MKENINYRIFVVSNPISAIHAALISQSFPHSKNILLLDSTIRKASFTNEIVLCSGKLFYKTINAGQVIDDKADLKPNLRKRLTRKLKNNFLFKPIYDKMLKRYLLKLEEKSTCFLKENLKEISNSDETELYLLTQTMINEALRNKFSNSTYYYFEHGLPDYLFALKPQTGKFGGLYCLFDDAFKSYCALNLNHTPPSIFPLCKKEDYKSYVNSLKNENIEQLLLRFRNKECVYIILQPLDKYELHLSFWKNYFDKIISRFNAANNILFLIKPHPLQSNDIVRGLKEWLTEKKINFQLLEKPDEISLSSELLFFGIQEKTIAVYSPFSYSLYYLAGLNTNPAIQFYHSYSSIKERLNHAPLQFKQQFLNHEQIIEKCFAKNVYDLHF